VSAWEKTKKGASDVGFIGSILVGGVVGLTYAGAHTVGMKIRQGVNRARDGLDTLQSITPL